MMRTKIRNKDLIERMKAYEEKHKPTLSESDVVDATSFAPDVSIITPVVQEVPAKTEVRSGPIPGPDTGISNMLINAINGEWDTIALYNDLITNLSAQGMNDIVEIITDINNEENIHVGQLQKALEKLSPNASSIKDGEEEASKDLAEG